ncbi:MAG: CDP-alcohol phosphatidyltransferase family protein [Pseudomonadota bacterium]
MNLFAVRKQADKVFHPLVSTLGRLPLSANAWTLAGTILGVLCAIVLYCGWWKSGVLLLLLRGLLDHVDGYVARSRHQSSIFGAIGDDVSDRWILGLIYGGGCLRLAEAYPHLSIVLVVGLTGSLTNVIAKSSITTQALNEITVEKGKLGHPVDNVGLFGSAEFIIYFGGSLLVMSIIDRPIAGVLGAWLVAIMSHISLAQRMVFAWHRYRHPLPANDESTVLASKESHLP